MTEYTNSPAEAYESLYHSSIQKTQLIDTPQPHEDQDQAKARAIQKLIEIKSGDISPTHQEILNQEAQILDVDLEANGWEKLFLEAHHDFVMEIDSKWSEKVREWTDKVIDALSQDLDPENTSQLKNQLQLRALNNWSSVSEPYILPEAQIVGQEGVSNAALRNVTLGLQVVIKHMARKNAPEPSSLEEIMDMIAQHEIMHSVSSIMVSDEEGFFGEAVRASSGINLKAGAESHGLMLNEATIEQYRRNRFVTGDNFAYESWVAIMNVADAIDPDFEKSRLLSFINHEERGAMVGRFENIFGPNSEQVLEKAGGNISKLSDLRQYGQQAVLMVDPMHKELAQNKFDEVYDLVVHRLTRLGLLEAS